MKIVSLLPSATEIVYALGLGGHLPAVRDGRVFVVNGSDYFRRFSRPGPRLVDSLEMLARLLHPQLFGPLQTSPAQVVQWALPPSEISEKTR